MLTEDGQRLVRIVTLSFLSLVATDEGHLEEAESHARAAKALVERLRPYRIPQTSLASIALGSALAERGEMIKPKRSWRVVFLRDEACPA